jgi:hypothetical protein
MAEPDFYKILGISPSASVDEIRLAYRELVKKYHPDLFIASTEKTRANERLLQINQAYAVLGDAERRRQYDEKRSSRRTTLRSPSTPTGRARSSTRTSTASARPQASTRTQKTRPVSWRTAKRQILKRWKYPTSGKLAASIVGVIIVAFIAQAVWEKPQTAIAWTLLAQTVVEPSKDIARQKLAGPNWTASGRYDSRSQCTDALKALVKRDEQEGSRAIFDERQGTIAITVHLRDEAALAKEYFEAKLNRRFNEPDGKASVDDEELLKQASEEAREFIRKNGLTNRVRNYECRQMQVLMPESWLRRKLKQTGLIS